MRQSIMGAALGAAITLLSVSAEAQTITLRAATIAPKTSVYNTAIAIPFAEYVANGTYTVKISANGQTLDTRTVRINNSNAWVAPGPRAHRRAGTVAPRAFGSQ